MHIRGPAQLGAMQDAGDWPYSIHNKSVHAASKLHVLTLTAHSKAVSPAHMTYLEATSFCVQQLKWDLRANHDGPMLKLLLAPQLTSISDG